MTEHHIGELLLLARRSVMPLADSENRNPDEVAEYLAVEKKIIEAEITRNNPRGYPQPGL